MKKLIGTILVLSTIFFGITSASAIDYQNQIKFNYKYNRSLNNTCYWVSSSASTFTSGINAAAYDWVHFLDNPIVMTPVSSSYATHMDFYGVPDSFFGGDGTLGRTDHYTSGGSRIYPDNGYWYFAEIRLNLDVLPSYSIQGTSAHEMGHAFGLAHWNSNPYSIMAQTVVRNVNTVQTIDNQHLIEKYS